jgi:hypothetical protein
MQIRSRASPWSRCWRSDKLIALLIYSCPAGSTLRRPVLHRTWRVDLASPGRCSVL